VSSMMWIIKFGCSKDDRHLDSVMYENDKETHEKFPELSSLCHLIEVLIFQWVSDDFSNVLTDISWGIFVYEYACVS
jgi:hypothetical protein